MTIRKKRRCLNLKEEALDTTLQNSLWKKLWTSGKKDYRMNGRMNEFLTSWHMQPRLLWESSCWRPGVPTQILLWGYGCGFIFAGRNSTCKASSGVMTMSKQMIFTPTSVLAKLLPNLAARWTESIICTKGKSKLSFKLQYRAVSQCIWDFRSCGMLRSLGW